MQFRIIATFVVFLGSYFPLALILAVQDVTQESWGRGICRNLSHCSLPSLDHPYFAACCVGVTLLCFVLTITILHNLRYKYPVEILSAKRVPNELISYSFPYIVSFMGVDYGATGKLAGFMIFMLWLFWITYRAGQIVLNPMLSIMGWGLYEAQVSINGHKRVVRLLSKVLPTPGTYLCQEIQGNYINMHVKKE